MRNSSLREKFQKIPIYRILLGFFFALLVFDIMKGAIYIGWVSKNDTLTSVLSILGLVVPLFKSHESKTIGRGNCWVFIAIIIELVIAIVLVNLTNRPNKIEPEKPIIVKEQCRENSLRQDSIQRCFGDLVYKFDNRMKQNLTYENVYQFLKDDYTVLRQIIQILENNPELTATSKYQYIDRFKNRADTAIVIINKAIYDTTLTPLECLKMSEKYSPQIKEIEQMRNDL